MNSSYLSEKEIQSRYMRTFNSDITQQCCRAAS